MKIKVDQEKCIGCGNCVAMCGKCFELRDGVSHPKSEDCECSDCDLKEVAAACPVGAISLEKRVGEKTEKDK